LSGSENHSEDCFDFSLYTPGAVDHLDLSDDEELHDISSDFFDNKNHMDVPEDEDWLQLSDGLGSY